MSNINKKYDIIKKLVILKKEQEHTLKLVTAKNNSNTVALATRQAICTNDQKDVDNVKANHKATGLAFEKLKHLEKEIKESNDNSRELKAQVEDMVKHAHTTARKTIECAVQFTELSKQIQIQEKKGGADKVVLLSLIANETATAAAVAEKAVTAANQALKDAMAAAAAVIHLDKSLEKAGELVTEAVPLFESKDKKSGLHIILETLKDKSHEQIKTANERLHEAEGHLKQSQRELSKAAFDLDVTNKQLDAAEKAIALASVN